MSLAAPLKPFCRENMDYIINDERYSKKMSDIIRPGTLKSLWKLIEWKNFNKKHPENWNVWPAKNTENAELFWIYDGKKWRTLDSKDVLQRMYDRLCDDVDNYLGYAKEKQIDVDTRKFADKLAKPLQFDMLHLDIDEDEFTLEMEDVKENFYQQTIQHIKNLSQDIKETPQYAKSIRCPF